MVFVAPKPNFDFDRRARNLPHLYDNLDRNFADDDVVVMNDECWHAAWAVCEWCTNCNMAQMEAVLMMLLLNGVVDDGGGGSVHALVVFD